VRVALYHNLPPGGALRAVWEFARRAGPKVECDLFTLDFAAADAFMYSRTLDSRRDFSKFVGLQVSELVTAGSWERLAGGHLTRVGLLKGIRDAEKRIANRINSGGYDVAYVHPCWFSQTPSVLVDLQVPTVYYMHEVRRSSFEPGYGTRAFPKNPRYLPGWCVEAVVEKTLRRRDRRAAAHADTLLCNSRYTAEMIERSYGRVATVAYLGIDEETFDVIEPVPGRRDNRVLSVGGLESFKGHHLTVEALSRLPDDVRPDLGLVYERYDANYRKQLLSMAQDKRVRVVEHRGIDDVELARLYGTSLATILTATLEPFGLVALESQASGTPVVAVREGGYRETVVDGVNGLMVERSVTALAEGLARVLNGELGTSPQAIRDTVVPHWTWDSAIPRQMDALKDAASRDQP
jgi:glycosyltransferase involved in cell wall biosynthesis